MTRVSSEVADDVVCVCPLQDGPGVALGTITEQSSDSLVSDGRSSDCPAVAVAAC